MIFHPHPYQHDIIGHQLGIAREATWAGMGTGKTVATMTALQIFQSLVDARPALVLAPLRVARSTWPDEIAKWDHLTGEAQVIHGNVKDRSAAVLGGLRRGNANLFTMNYENIPWLVDFLADLKRPWPFSRIIADESTKLKSYRTRQGGQRAQALFKVAWEHVDYFNELTGTPAPNGLKDLWGQIAFIDAGQRLGRSYTAYMTRWFQKDYTGFNWTPMDHAQAEIEERLRDVVVTITKGLDVDEPIVNKVMVELPSAIRTKYSEMEKAAYTEIRDQGFEAVHAAARTNKCLQITSGAIYDEHGVWHELHSEKLQALESIVGEAGGMPVLVAYNFVSDRERLAKAFPAMRFLDSDPQTIRDWNAGKIAMLAAHPASAGHGLNLQDGSNILAFFSIDWNLEFHDQIIERIGPTRQKQSGYDRPVFIHYILADNTVDEVVFDRLVNKRSVQDALMDAMRKRGL